MRMERLSAACAGQTVTLRALLPGSGAKDHALAALVVGLCSLPPIPMPGLSVAFALVAVVAGTRMALGLPPWLPKTLSDRPLPARVPARLFSWAAGVLRKGDRLLRPRALWAAAPAARMHGAAIAACGVMLLIPIPPPTNIPPAAALIALSLGVLEDDGAAVLLGHAAVAGSAAFFAALFCVGWNGLRALLVSL